MWRKAFAGVNGGNYPMIIPCIDLQDGRAVQLVHGRKRRLAVDDVFGLLERFREYPLLHVIDLDAAMGRGSNARLVRRALPTKRRCACAWAAAFARRARGERILDAGAEKIIVGSAAFRRRPGESALFSRAWRRAVGRKRIIVAVDTDGGRILVRGWQEKLRLHPEEVFPGAGTIRFGVSVHLRGRGGHHARHESRLVPRAAARDAAADYRGGRHPQRSERCARSNRLG